MPDIERIAASLTKAQREALAGDWDDPTGQMIWDLAKIGAANCVGLTPLGYDLCTHLTNGGQDV